MPAVELALDEPPDACAGADAVWCGADAEGAAEPEPPELDPPPQPATAIATTASMPEPAAVNRDSLRSHLDSLRTIPDAVGER